MRSITFNLIRVWTIYLSEICMNVWTAVHIADTFYSNSWIKWISNKYHMELDVLDWDELDLLFQHSRSILWEWSTGCQNYHSSNMLVEEAIFSKRGDILTLPFSSIYCMHNSSGSLGIYVERVIAHWFGQALQGL